MNKTANLLKDAWISLVAGAAVGLIVAAFSAPPFGRAAFGAIVIAVLCSFGLIRAWRGLSGEKALAVIMITAFLVRILLGIVIYQMLPTAGNGTPGELAGYVYSDAYERDTAAIQLAQSGGNILSSFLGQFKSDQYGGLLAVTALVYKAFSPDAARPLLITLLAAFTSTVGLAFLWSALKGRFSRGFALAATWLVALYPEGVLLGSSQMREPFLIGLGCIAFWAAVEWKYDKLKAFLVFLGSVVGLVLFSAPAGMIIAGACVALVVLEFTITTQTQVNRWTGIEVLAIMGFAAVIAGWMWLQPTLYFSMYQSVTGSGMLQAIFESAPEKLRILFVTVYGLLQPVLPAAVTDFGRPFWTVVAILRAAGWWLMLPFILYAFFALWRKEKEENHWILILVGMLFLVWTIVSSARAGGDQWDNPRYRAILLPWMAMVFAWVWLRVKEVNPVWFWRWVGVVGAITLGFTNWYLTRKFGIGLNMSFYSLVAWVGIASVAILAGSLIWDFVHRPKRIKPAEDSQHG